MPKIDDIMKSPTFGEDASNIGNDYPKLADAPAAPTDLRSDRQWDIDARNLQALRDDRTGTQNESGPSTAEADQQFESLKAKVQAYKKDDPASGPVQQAFPNYKPRR